MIILRPDKKGKEYNNAPPPHVVDGICVDTNEEETITGANIIDNSEANKKKKKMTPAKCSMLEFCSKPKLELANALEFEYFYGKGNNIGKITWQILKDQEYITGNDKILDAKILHNPIEEDIYWSKLNESFLEHVIPSVVGNAALLD